MGKELDLDDVAGTSPLAQKELAELRAELSRAEAHLERIRTASRKCYGMESPAGCRQRRTIARIRTAFRECYGMEYHEVYEIHASRWEALERAITGA